MPTEQSKPKRPSISKRLRFDIFKRDLFTCQYCQRSGPDVMLQLDHKVPFWMGGLTDESNLITSCEECNLGKAGRPLESSSASAAPRPLKLRPALTVKDGHSHAQQAVYEAMWAAGKPCDGGRSVVIGLGELSQLVRISKNNCRINIRSMVEKSSVLPVADARCKERIGTTYLVRSEAEIMALRKAAGLNWVLRSKGAMLVTDPTP